MSKKVEVSADILGHLDYAYFIKLFLVFTAGYYFNIFYWGLTDPDNYYSPFLDTYVNYIDWLGTSILYGAKQIAAYLGQNTYVDSPQLIRTVSGTSVILSYGCLGLGINSFWLAFVIANSGTWQRKVYWCLGGMLLIWVINCCRIALLLIALEKNWQDLHYIDHHDVFNIVSYILILSLMYFYTSERKFVYALT